VASLDPAAGGRGGRHDADVIPWPSTPEELVELQLRLAAATPEPWAPAPGVRVGGCFVCFERGGHGPGRPGDRGWAAATLEEEVVVVRGEAAASYEAGLLALREGALLARAASALAVLPDVLLVDATGRDHPRRAGLALHLGAALTWRRWALPIGRSSPVAPGRPTCTVPRAPCFSTVSVSVPGSALAPGRDRSPCTQPGGPTRTSPSRSSARRFARRALRSRSGSPAARRARHGLPIPVGTCDATPVRR
jgi:hypothetical protein